jgi:excisionase family DNA binding protein
MSDNGKPADILSRLDRLEDAFVAGLQEIREAKQQLKKNGNGNGAASLEKLLDAEEVAALLGVDQNYIYGQARANKIPSIKLGKYRKFSPSQLAKWLERKNHD